MAGGKRGCGGGAGDFSPAAYFLRGVSLGPGRARSKKGVGSCYFWPGWKKEVKVQD